MASVETNSDSVVDRVYEQLKAMSIGFEFKPGERLNEGELAKRLGVSRTPLREALNRLNTEGFLRFAPGRGFFCRELDAHEIFDLYELRKSIEVASVRLAIKRAKDEDIDALLKFLEATGPELKEGAIVSINKPANSPNQKWTITPKGDGLYTIKPSNSPTLVLAIAKG